MSRKIRNKDAMKGPLGSLRRADSRVSELSPSDATLLIGISIPSSRYDDSPHNLSTAPTLRVTTQSDSGKSYASKPEIVITPAKEQWSAIDAYANLPDYMTAEDGQVANGIRHVSGESNVPKLPSIPLLSSLSGQYDTKHSKRERRDDRVTSLSTDIDEDASPNLCSLGRPISGESQLKMLRRLSGDTVATRHRSKGWWNQVLSPYLQRSNTIMTRNSPIDKEKCTPPPFNEKQQRPASPETDIEEDVGIDARTSIWTDMSRWEAARRTMRMTNAQADHSRHGPTTLLSAKEKFSPDYVPFAGFGAASEYYNACWHDQNSPTPFFKCRNHDCSTIMSVTPSTLENDIVTRQAYDSPATITSQGVPDKKDNFYQKPANRFSAAFGQAQYIQARPTSEATVIEEDPEITPEVQEARAAPVVRARAPVATRPLSLREDPDGLAECSQIKSNHIPVLTPPRPSRNNGIVYNKQVKDQDMVADKGSLSPKNRGLNEEHIFGQPIWQPRPTTASILYPVNTEEIKSPEALTPSFECSLQPRDALPMSHLREIPLVPVQNIYNFPRPYDRTHVRLSPNPFTTVDFGPPPYFKSPENAYTGSNERQFGRQNEADMENVRAYRARKRNSVHAQLDGQRKKKKNRCLYLSIIGGLLVILALILGLALGLTRQHADIPVQSSWLNLTGYPPIPTGISTIAQPDAIVENTGCVFPSTLWSCALPKEEQASESPNAPDQPNFRVEIRFDNGTTPANSTTSRKLKRSGYAAFAGSTIRTQLLQIRDTFTDALYTSNPAPPSQEDQVFLGNTTDGIVFPFDGEYTPFYISFLATTPIPSKLRKRQSQVASNSTDPFPNITVAIPQPDVNPDGTAAAANLLTFPSAQPIRLYNRGLPTEHYGFYNYFDRSIFLKSTALLNSTDVGPVPDDVNGGSPEDAATVRCTWAQTRFLVQIWTNQGNSSTLLSNGNSVSPGTPPTGQLSSTPENATDSSANDFSRPGSFPYPVTVTLDRHGGDIYTKMIYCYGLDDREHIIPAAKKIQLENRSFGGTAVNPALGVFQNVNVTLAEGGPGGIDGGTGGCSCQWRNWEHRN